MNIDYYCFIVDEYGQNNYTKRKQFSKAKIYENFEFDMEVAKSLNKIAIFCKEKGRFYDGNWRELNLSGKAVLPRCIIPETDELYSAIDKAGAESIVSREDLEKVYSWPEYIKPANREVIETTNGEFLRNFKSYKEKFGRVFFKTKRKNISCEVCGVFCMNDMVISEVSSDNDLFGGTRESKKVSAFFSEPVYMVFSDKFGLGNDVRFSYLKDDEPVFVQQYVEVVKDEVYPRIPVEYRSFVVNGKITTSRSWIPNRPVPKEVKLMTAQIVEAMPEDMNKTFVVDVLEFKDSEGVKHYDLCELNPIVSAGYEQGSSIFITEPTYNESFKYPKYDDLSSEVEQE